MLVISSSLRSRIMSRKVSHPYNTTQWINKVSSTLLQKNALCFSSYVFTYLTHIWCYTILLPRIFMCKKNLSQSIGATMGSNSQCSNESINYSFSLHWAESYVLSVTSRTVQRVCGTDLLSVSRTVQQVCGTDLLSVSRTVQRVCRSDLLSVSRTVQRVCGTDLLFIPIPFPVTKPLLLRARKWQLYWGL